MAVKDSKRSISPAQLSARDSRKTNPRKTNTKTDRHVFHPLTQRGRTAGSRSERRRFYHFDKVRGQTLDFVEFYTAGEYHCLDLRFQVILAF